MFLIFICVSKSFDRTKCSVFSDSQSSDQGLSAESRLDEFCSSKCTLAIEFLSIPQIEPP